MRKDWIGQRLLALRGRRSRVEVARALGISVSALQMYENGNRMPRDDMKVSIAAYYGVTVQQLFFDPEPHDLCSAEKTDEG